MFFETVVANKPHSRVGGDQFEEVHPGNGQLDQRYREHYAIKKFLDDTSLEPSVDGKPLRFDFQGSSAEPERPHYERAGTWFLHARVRLRDDRNFSDLLADRLPRQEASLKAASLITYACDDVSEEVSEHPGTMQVHLVAWRVRERYSTRHCGGMAASWR